MQLWLPSINTSTQHTIQYYSIQQNTRDKHHNNKGQHKKYYNKYEVAINN